MHNLISKVTEIRTLKIPKTQHKITTSFLRLLITGCIMMLFAMWGNIAITKAHNAAYYPWFNITLICTAMMMSCKWNVPKNVAKWLSRIAIIALPMITLFMAEIPNTHFTKYPLLWWFTYSFYMYIYIFGYGCTGKLKYSIYIFNPIIWVITVASHYVYKFRGTAFVPLDIFYADTAATVAHAYDFTPNHELLFSTLLLVTTIVIASKLHPPTNTIKWKFLTKRIIAIVLVVILFGSYFTSDKMANFGFRPDFYKPELSSSRFGNTMNFWIHLKYLSVQKPDGYNADSVPEKLLNLLGEPQKNATMEKRPHVICIMNEAFSDLSVRGEFTTNKDYMPFTRNLKENTIKGNLYMPVLGNGTCNSELEFLTGFSTAFIPAGSKPYSLYIKDQIPTVTKIFESHGYQSIAFHPYYKNNWNRINVYQNMGFDKYYGMEDVLSPEILQLFNTHAPLPQIEESLLKAFPNEQALMREYLSDEFNHNRIIEWYEQNKNSESPLFLFNVSMQNHGGFGAYSNFDGEIYVTNEDGTPKNIDATTNQYLSLVYESDKALRQLVEYFEAQDEPVVLVMFGDHQPEIDNKFMNAISGLQASTDANIKQVQNRYVTPFLIWANYDIEEHQFEKLSANYLSSYLMDALGMPMPPFNQYLLKLSKILPVINTQGYITADGKYYTFEHNTEYTKLIEDYRHICYNFLFDTENRCDALYYAE